MMRSKSSGMPRTASAACVAWNACFCPWICALVIEVERGSGWLWWSAWSREMLSLTESAVVFLTVAEGLREVLLIGLVTREAGGVD